MSSKGNTSESMRGSGVGMVAPNKVSGIFFN